MTAMFRHRKLSLVTGLPMTGSLSRMFTAIKIGGCGRLKEWRDGIHYNIAAAKRFIRINCRKCQTGRIIIISGYDGCLRLV